MKDFRSARCISCIVTAQDNPAAMLTSDITELLRIVCTGTSGMLSDNE